MRSIEQIDAEIARLQAELASVERMPRPISERYDEAAARLREAEGVYRQWGFDASAGHPGEAQHMQRQSLIGALMVVNSAALLKAEHERIAAAGEGLSEREKTERLAQLRRQIERLCAQRELQLREREAPGEFLPRPVLHAEMAVFRKPDLERLAA
jgi:hypothetical protein